MRTPSIYASTKLAVNQASEGLVKSVSMYNKLVDYGLQELDNSMRTSANENADETIVEAIESSRQFTALLNDAESKQAKTVHDTEQLEFEKALLAKGRANIMSRF